MDYIVISIYINVIGVLVMRVGIIIVNYNNSSVTKLAIDSIIKAKSDVEYYVVVVDNGSLKDDANKLQKYLTNKFRTGLKGNYISSQFNLGFSGGNNLGIKHCLEIKSISHICLLNSDVVVADYWLDRLTLTDSDAIGPVTNAVGNEQTVPVSIDLAKNNKNAFSIVNKFSQTWYEHRKKWLVKSDDLHFFAVLFKKSVVNKVGLLDERFYPGSFEDVDYCIRLKEAGFEMKIHRGIFVYHFGSASFGKLDLNNRINVSITNLHRLEDKWQFKWLGDEPKLLLSFKQDVDKILSENQKLIYGQSLNNHYRNLNKIFTQLISDRRELVSENNTLKLSINNRISIKNLARKLIKVLKLLSYIFLNLSYARVLFKLIRYRINQRAIVVMSGYYTDYLLKDGFYRRVKLIDDLLQSYFRVYIKPEQTFNELIIRQFNNNVVEIGYDPNSKIQRVYILLLCLVSGQIYYQSVLNYLNWHKSRLLNSLLVRNIWDVHGAVPEEFAYHEDYKNAQLYGDVEQRLVKNANVIVCVTKIMKKHLSNKYGLNISRKVIVFPNEVIFSENYEKKVKPYYKNKPNVIYAGGLMKWQMVDLMQDLIYSNISNAHYYICVPEPQEFWSKWNHRDRPASLIVQSKSREDIYSEIYKKAHYGFILREDVILNNVSCPTKLVEYLENDVIPIMKTKNIGDFQKMGLMYLSMDDFKRNKFFSKEKYEVAVNNNRKVFKQYVSLYNEGKSRMNKLFNNKVVNR